jgi:hypothetical protein
MGLRTLRSSIVQVERAVYQMFLLRPDRLQYQFVVRHHIRD